MRSLVVRFIHEDEGQDLIEYALLAGLITTGVALTIASIGTKVKDLFTALEGAVTP